MNKWAVSLLAVAAATSCKGEESSSGNSDTTAPVVAITASSQEVQGGETIALTVTATDDRDPSVTPRLSCTGGNLTGNLLVISPTQTAQTITCTAEATDQAGNTGRASVTIQVRATTTVVVPAEGTNVLRAGGIGVLLTENLPLTSETYQGRLGNRPVTVRRSGAGTLFYLVPIDMSPGDHRLEVSISNRLFTYAVKTEAARTASAPRDVLETALRGAKDGLLETLRTDSSRMTPAEREIANDQLAKLDAALAALPSLPADDASKLATLLLGNGLSLGATPQYFPIEFEPGSCGEQVILFGKKSKDFVGWSVISAGSVVLALELSPVPAAAVVAVGAFAVSALVAREEFLKLKRYHWPDLQKACWRETNTKLVPWEQFTNSSRIMNFVAPTAVEEKLAFQQGQSRKFRIERTKDIDENHRRAANRAAQSALESISALPFLPDSLKDYADAFQSRLTEFVPANRVSVTNISRPGVTGAASADADVLTLGFRASDPSEKNIDFTFTLARQAESPITVSASLSVDLPEADDAAVQGTQGREIASRVQVRGAESLEVVTPPANGQVSLRPDGSFTYNPTGQFFGSDRFTYRARNANGVSKPATVLIDVMRMFQGWWLVTTRSITTSQSHQGLCPDETRTSTVVVNRVTDTQYSATYSGVPITLTMANADDPNGLRGTVSGTYPDGPGQTTSSVEIRVPNSSSLAGSSTWSYRGPNNTSCSGRTEISGRRP